MTTLELIPHDGFFGYQRHSDSLVRHGLPTGWLQLARKMPFSSSLVDLLLALVYEYGHDPDEPIDVEGLHRWLGRWSAPMDSCRQQALTWQFLGIASELSLLYRRCGQYFFTP